MRLVAGIIRVGDSRRPKSAEDIRTFQKAASIQMSFEMSECWTGYLSDCPRLSPLLEAGLATLDSGDCAGVGAGAGCLPRLPPRDAEELLDGGFEFDCAGAGIKGDQDFRTGHGTLR